MEQPASTIVVQCLTVPQSEFESHLDCTSCFNPVLKYKDYVQLNSLVRAEASEADPLREDAV